jgi:hypothetical protein
MLILQDFISFEKIATASRNAVNGTNTAIAWLQADEQFICQRILTAKSSGYAEFEVFGQNFVPHGRHLCLRFSQTHEP